MAMLQNRRAKSQCRKDTFGLLASGSSGAWEIDIDEALSGPERWRAQIEGPSLTLDFEIPSLDVVDKMVRLLATPSAKSKRTSNGAPGPSGTLVLGGNDHTPVRLLKDDEYQ